MRANLITLRIELFILILKYKFKTKYNKKIDNR